MRCEPCLCGALDCTACRGEEAQYAGVCEGCAYAEDEDTGTCVAVPGGPACQRIARDEDRWVEHQLHQRQED